MFQFFFPLLLSRVCSLSSSSSVSVMFSSCPPPSFPLPDGITVFVRMWLCICTVSYIVLPSTTGWLRLVGSLKLHVFFAKEPYKERRYSAKETYNFKESDNRSHPISATTIVIRGQVKCMTSRYTGWRRLIGSLISYFAKVTCI